MTFLALRPKDQDKLKGKIMVSERQSIRFQADKLCYGNLSSKWITEPTRTNLATLKVAKSNYNITSVQKLGHIWDVRYIILYYLETVGSLQSC